MPKKSMQKGKMKSDIESNQRKRKTSKMFIVKGVAKSLRDVG